MPRTRSRVRGSRDKKSKDPRTQATRCKSLREEAGGRTEELAGTAEPDRAEPDPVVVEGEVRRALEGAIGLARDLIAGAVDPEFTAGRESLGVSEDYDPAGKSPEAELVGQEDLTGTADGTATVAHAELGGDDLDFALLRLGDEVERVRRASVNSQITRYDLALAVAAEIPRLCDLSVDELDGLAVSLG